ncbi:BMP family ABC transporter substrate-binding protein [Nocardia blacklockiae]|uniref:BMP family ABC transporter substrate-binding protein n=1 Tax=Nocardia blacklockiae TaxID=480036 RepID=UPI00189468E4|nr:BMP family ABC transporter substrate-binding protein [Nocardia blacklockiae]MBF6169946.1 BMP family ABC transporter substrate-binding protein [Nocardia blacklockiae]
MAAVDALPSARRTVRALCATVAALLFGAVTACGGGTSADAGAAEIIYVTNAPIGQNQFLELGRTGTERAAAALGARARTYESTDEQSRRANLEAAIARRPLAIVLITYEFNDLAVELAERHPDQQFVLVDSCPPQVPENLRCGKFKEYESSYLLGVEAGLLTRGGRIGTVAAKDSPFFHRWSDAFALGARSVNPQVLDSQLFVGGENAVGDPARSKELALTTIHTGADQVYAVTGGGNGGVFEAAAQSRDVLAYGVDVNQCPQAPGVVVDNAIKRVDKVVLDLLTQVRQGAPGGTSTEFGLAQDGSTVTSLTADAAASGCVILRHPDVLQRVREARDAIVAGHVTIPHADN